MKSTRDIYKKSNCLLMKVRKRTPAFLISSVAKENMKMKVKYIVVKTTYRCEGKERTAYGIAMADVNCDGMSVIKTCSDLSEDEQKVSSFVTLCNKAELSPVHFFDAVEDFLAE